MARIAIMALEGLEIEEEAVGTDIPVEEIADQPENDLAEMQEVATEMEGGEDSIDEAVETADTLGEVRDQMEETLPEGGMEPAAAAAVEVAVEHMCKRLGFPAKRSGFALEAFGDKATRVQATKIAMETISEQIKKIWAAIVAAFDKAIAWVKKFFESLFNGATRLAERANKLGVAAKAKIAEGATLQADAKVTKGVGNVFSFAKYLSKDGKFLTSSEIVSSYKELAGNSSAANFNNNEEAISQALDKCYGLLEQSGDKKYTEQTVNGIFGKFERKLSTNKSVSVAEGMELQETPLPMGDFSVFYQSVAKKNTGDEFIKNVGKMKIWVGANKGEKTAGELASTPFELKDIEAVAAEVEAHMKKYEGSRQVVKGINDAQSKIKDAAKKLAEGKTDAEAKGGNDAANIARAILSISSSGLTSIRSYDINVAKAVLDFGSKSLGQYKKAA